MDHAQAPEPAEPTPRTATALPAAPAAAGPQARVEMAPGALGPAHLPPAALLELQRTVGNTATLALLHREAAGRRRPAVAQRTVLQRNGEGAAPAVSAKHTYTVPDKKLAEADAIIRLPGRSAGQFEH